MPARKSMLGVAQTGRIKALLLTLNFQKNTLHRPRLIHLAFLIYFERAGEKNGRHQFRFCLELHLKIFPGEGERSTFLMLL